nr:type IIL restriction-modification enzyme MmeI [Spirulina subsalsa]
MRKIEAEINRRRGEADRSSEIPLTNFRGVEIRHFAAEIARLALIIAEFQCDVLHRRLQLALLEFLPLKNDNWITCGNALVVPRVSSENREFLPVGLVQGGTIIGDRNFALYDAPLWNMALIASRLHWVWIGTVCVRMRTDFSYSNTLGWNTFPVPTLTEQNKIDLTRCAEDILCCRTELYKPKLFKLW